MQPPDILAFELAAALDAYEEQLAALASTGRLIGVAQLQRTLHQVSQSCVGLPQLAGATVDLVLSHHGFVADLMRDGGSGGAPASEESVQALEHCVRSLQRQCRQMFVAPHLH